ncbi:unnamed protein product [Spirodela intermedia]|uniref:Inositol polyphosphate-related phosphatase domain-containing protein n=1 Tax=Spirodela intermedia TaxID=51605 RepID=A0A7I8IAL2_SPIIN|nr:unnamed protein product [Spirodela intermedia]CAA6654072.1 unnamed protein product [Spirodela intermedia]
MSAGVGVGAALPEFTGAGGDQGIFKLPLRAPVHPGRPPSLDLRPHPLRETQAGSFLRTIACTPTQLWAGQESGVRFWNFSDLYEGQEGEGRILVRGDEESAPFRISHQTSPTLCMVVDAATHLVWTGHKDGKIRSSGSSQHIRSFKEGLAWQAHRSPVLSMIITSYGGVIKAWPWEAVEKSLSLPTEERHMAALLLERSYIDLRSNVTVGGVCALPASDVKYLLSDNLRSKVWSGGYLSFALWDSRTKELLKVFGIDGQVDTRLDISPVNDAYIEDEMKMKFAATSKKEKSQGSVSFFQRSRNALMGAADAVRRVAVKSAFGDDNRRAEALAISMDGMIWMGCANGLLVQWDGNGNRLQEFNHNSPLFFAFALMDLEGNRFGSWVAHSSPVIKMTVGNGFVFTLANHGGIRGWNLTSPGPLDKILLTELTNRQILASHDSLIVWLGSAASEVGLVVVGLQEVEMGAGFLAMAAAKETVGLEGSANGQWWLDTIGKTLDEGQVSNEARKNLRAYIGDIDAAAVPCGFGRAIGNKGAVGLRIRIYDRIMCFVNCHFAAHLEAVNRRNADFDHVYRTMTFSRQSQGLNAANAGASSALQLFRGPNVRPLAFQTDDWRPDLSEADMVIFLGDFNYRLHGISYDEARDFVSQRCFDWLREKDQLRAEMKLGKYFKGSKKRIPAWCDRILYRDSRSVSSSECSLECPVVSSICQYDACMDVTDSDHKPVRCIFNVDIARADELTRRQEFGEIMMSNEKITSLLEEVCTVPETIVSTNSIILQNQDVTILRITNISETEKAMFEIACERQSAIMEDGFATDHSARGAFGFPQWLEVAPAAGMIRPGQTVEVSMQHEDLHTLEEFVDGVLQNRWYEDLTRDKEVVLLVHVTGDRSTERRRHRVTVRHCFSSRASGASSLRGPSQRTQSSVLHRSDFRYLGSSSDIVDDFHYMHDS